MLQTIKKRKSTMWLKKRICCILLLLSALVFIGYLGFERTRGSYSSVMPADFNFCANIESDSYILDTYNNTLTKTIYWEEDTTITLIVNKESIYNLLKKIDIFKYPPTYAPTSTISIDPSLSYNLKFTMDSIATEINWEENTESENKDAKRFRNIFEKIEEYIEQQDEVKSLPEARGRFM